MSNATDFYYDNLVCPECGGHQKNCEHFWAGHVIGQKFGDFVATERIIKLLEGLTVADYVEIRFDQLVALINGQKDNETVVLLTKNDAEQLAKAIEGETE